MEPMELLGTQWFPASFLKKFRLINPGAIYWDEVPLIMHATSEEIKNSVGEPYQPDYKAWRAYRKEIKNLLTWMGCRRALRLYVGGNKWRPCEKEADETGLCKRHRLVRRDISKPDADGTYWLKDSNAETWSSYNPGDVIPESIENNGNRVIITYKLGSSTRVLNVAKESIEHRALRALLLVTEKAKEEADRQRLLEAERSLWLQHGPAYKKYADDWKREHPVPSLFGGKPLSAAETIMVATARAVREPEQLSIEEFAKQKEKETGMGD
jgi:hypothetical protein